VTFSQRRLYGRLRSSHWEKPRYLRGPDNLDPLYVVIDRKLTSIQAPSTQSQGMASLRAALVDLSRALKAVEDGTGGSQIELLQTAIEKSYAVSRHGGSKSLEDNLRKRRMNSELVLSRQVLEIDKISKYLEVCHDLIRLGRQVSTRDACANLKLVRCEGYRERTPPGSKASCFVHGEVQLVMFYEQNPRNPPPRAIGSSKSACFLCDMFIRAHGRFGISSTHMKFYPRWTIPDVHWLDTQQLHRLRGVIDSMNSQLQALAKKMFTHHNFALESRAHILRLEAESSLESSVASPTESELVIRAPQPALNRGEMLTQTPVMAAPCMTPVISTFWFSVEDLPITEIIMASTLCLRLLVGRVTYIFDCAEMEHGELQVSRSQAREPMSVDIEGLAVDESMCLRPHSDSSAMTFSVHDAGADELTVAVKWT